MERRPKSMEQSEQRGSGERKRESREKGRSQVRQRQW